MATSSQSMATHTDQQWSNTTQQANSYIDAQAHHACRAGAAKSRHITRFQPSNEAAACVVRARLSPALAPLAVQSAGCKPLDPLIEQPAAS